MTLFQKHMVKHDVTEELVRGALDAQNPVPLGIVLERIANAAGSTLPRRSSSHFGALYDRVGSTLRTLAKKRVAVYLSKAQGGPGWRLR